MLSNRRNFFMRENIMTVKKFDAVPTPSEALDLKGI